VRTLADSDLVTAAQAGDQEALTTLLAEHMPLAYNVIGRALNGHPDVDDVVQETMVRVVQGLPGLRDPASFRSWLVAIAFRQVQQRGRERAATVRAIPLDEAVDSADPAADFVDTTVDRLGLTGERRDLVEASRWLKADDRRLLALWWQELDGALNRTELADALEISPRTAAVRVQRMRAQLATAWTLTRAWRAEPRCPELTAEGRAWDGTFHTRWFKRLGRHVRSCERCRLLSYRPQSIDHLLAGIGLVPLPGLLLNRVPGLIGGGAHPLAGHVALQVPGFVRRIGQALAGKSAAVATAAVVGTASFSLAVYYSPAHDQDGIAGAPTVEPALVAPVPGGPARSRPAASPAGRAPGVASAAPALLSGVAVADYYVAPTGSDTAAGTLKHPFASLGKAVSVVRPGQTIAVRGGTYRPTEAVAIKTAGAANRRITVSNYRDERPVIDAGKAPADRWYITQEADYWTVQGLEIKNSGSHAYVCLSCQHDVFRRLSIHGSQGTAFILRGEQTVGNQILDSDFFDNHDDDNATSNAAGLGVTYGSGAGNVIHGCRTYDNADDGIVLAEFTDGVTIDHSWSYGNGVNRWNIPTLKGDGNGFSLGAGSTVTAVKHLVTNSAAWANGGAGFNQSGNTGAVTLRNDTAYQNGSAGFAFGSSSAVLSRDLALANNREVALGAEVVDTGNSWNQSGWSTAVLLGTDPTAAQAARPRDGILPGTTFLTNSRDAKIGAPMS
jgi:RNA polymerase sigma factor (sigma-70 family)